jgi:hypothetical protein
MSTFFWHLQLFAGEGGDGGSAGTGAGAAQTGVAGAAAPNGSMAQEPGVPGTAPAGAAAGTAQEEETFESLAKGKYKKDYDASVQRIVRDRLKGSQKTRELVQKLQPALQMLGQQYGIDASDLDTFDADALTQKLLDDKTYYEQEAVEKGLPVDTVISMHRMERENARLRASEEAARHEQENQQHFAQLVQQFDGVKQIYPGADLEQELDNPAFAQLIANGVDARAAFEVAHLDEIQRGAMAYAVQTSAAKLSASVQANRRRPAENAAGRQAPASAPFDPRNLTPAQREDIRRRVARGEKIPI